MRYCFRRTCTGEHMRFVKTLENLRKDQRGVTAIEFAFLALPFFGLILGIIQLGFIFLTSQTLSAAIDTAAREIKTGQVRDGQITIADFRSSICDRLVVVANCDQTLEVSVQAFPSFAATTSTTFYNSNNFPIITSDYDTGDGGNVVVINAAVTIPFVAGSLFRGVNATGQSDSRLTTSLVFTNENFATLASN